MNLLVLDTATEACSAALYRGGRLHQRFANAPQQHTRLLPVMVAELVAESGCSLASLDALGYGRGPGSFTGIRIATGFVQGLALALNRPVVGISSLAALAQQALDQGACRVACALDARQGQVYWGCYAADPQGLATPLEPEMLADPERLPPLAGEAWWACGHGWLRHGELLRRTTGIRAERTEADWLPRAAEMTRLALAKLAQGQGQAATHAEPVYLRDQVAWKRAESASVRKE